MNPSPTLLHKLDRSKLLTRWAAASVGVGERRSKTKGEGMEFADHREYQPGDDPRRLDPHLYARFGRNYIREYEIYRQLPVTILIDASRSMEYGEPSKFAYASSIASLLGFVGLVGGDRVEIGVGAGERVHWSPRFHGVMRAQAMFNWLSSQSVSSSGSFAAALRVAMRHLTERGLLIVLSDWWADDLESELGILSATGQELWGMHVAAPEELDPARLGPGEVRLADSETGQEVEITLDATTVGRYRRGLDAWRAQLQGMFAAINGRYLLLPTDQSTEKLLLQDWRRMGMLV